MQLHPTVQAVPARVSVFGDQLLASFPSQFARLYLELLHQVAPEHQVTFCSHGMGAEVDMRVSPRLSKRQAEQWDQLYEKTRQELDL